MNPKADRLKAAIDALLFFNIYWCLGWLAYFFVEHLETRSIWDWFMTCLFLVFIVLSVKSQVDFVRKQKQLKALLKKRDENFRDLEK